MVATINQQVEQTEECVSTCRFAQRVALVKNSSAINEELDPSLVRKGVVTHSCAERDPSGLKRWTAAANR
jgi:hypothetical protein